MRIIVVDHFVRRELHLASHDAPERLLVDIAATSAPKEVLSPVAVASSCFAADAFINGAWRRARGRRPRAAARHAREGIHGHTGQRSPITLPLSLQCPTAREAPGAAGLSLCRAPSDLVRSGAAPGRATARPVQEGLPCNVEASAKTKVSVVFRDRSGGAHRQLLVFRLGVETSYGMLPRIGKRARLPRPAFLAARHWI